MVPCDATKSPVEERCVIDSLYGVFVSPSAPDNGDGSKAKPFKTLKKAIEQAGTRRIYACADAATPYTEALTLTSAASGLRIYGGFDCTTWSYSVTNKAVIDAPSTTALTLDKVSGLTLVDFDIRAKTATNPGESSVAVFAKGSSGVKFTRVKLTAGDGADGAAGTLTKFTGFPTDLNGKNGSATEAGIGCGTVTPIVCPGGGTTAGGNGGAPDNAAGNKGEDGKPVELTGGKGGTVEKCSDPVAPVGGGNGTSPAAVHGASATTLGTLTEAGWTPASGTVGKDGQPGQGGGGGASVNASGGGGGGGCGGCGGAAAKAATGGGGSIALLSLQSDVSLEACEFNAGNGGKGGDGVAGQDGQDGGLRGLPGGSACVGGNGGKGQNGGAAGSGAGGVSVGILFSGTAPVKDAATTLSPHSAGPGGAAVDKTPILAGKDGAAAPVMPAPTT